MVPCPPEACILPCYSLMADGALQVSVSGLQKRTGEADTVERQMICKKKVFFLGKKKMWNSDIWIKLENSQKLV